MERPVNQQPLASKQFDRVHVAIWPQEKKENDNGGRLWFSVGITRRYQDGSGQWQSSNHYTARDLPHLQLAVQWAMRELLLKEE
ncbi:MAG: hypothetical protein KA354_14355 [Phycisphaerae bacterium]|nr:hypothetical protein [Phycisphaerae bacterium]